MHFKRANSVYIEGDQWGFTASGLWLQGLLCWLVVFASLFAAPSFSLDFSHAHDRVAVDRETGSPLVAHVTVVLCTNRTRVTDACHKDRKDTNIYWGGPLGIKTYFREQEAWQSIPVSTPTGLPVLERVLYRRDAEAGGSNIYLVADVWRGGNVKKAITHFLTMTSGEGREKLRVGDEVITLGGDAHVLAYLGHNGIDQRHLALGLDETINPHAAIVLGRGTASTFTDALLAVGSYPLLLTADVMTPQADILEAALLTWFSTGVPGSVQSAAANQYRKTRGGSVNTSMRLFVPGSTQ